MDSGQIASSVTFWIVRIGNPAVALTAGRTGVLPGDRPFSLPDGGSCTAGTPTPPGVVPIWGIGSGGTLGEPGGTAGGTGTSGAGAPPVAGGAFGSLPAGSTLTLGGASGAAGGAVPGCGVGISIFGGGSWKLAGR